MGTRNDALLIDLDGVLYQEGQLIEGALDTMDWIESQRIDYLFLTNTTSRSRASLVEKLEGMGINTQAEKILTPIVAATQWLKQNSIHSAAVFVKEEACTDFSGLQVIDLSTESAAEAVIIGDLGENWTYPLLNRAFQLLMRDPQPLLIALGMTRYWRNHGQLNLDVAPFVKALEFAADCNAQVMGKPSPGFFQSALDILATTAEHAIMVGDDIHGDIGGAHEAGIRGILVKTGKFRSQNLQSNIKAAGLLDSFAQLPQWWRKNINSNQ